ncbi:uncharacterized protein [Dysidea avara]|uniref:uncharacterized protein isoform X2 n=1 Tax=Dysidea avara TaxID=196820 RepID=UPI0033258612
MFSHQTLLDIWNLNHEDINRYCCGKLNDCRSEQSDAAIGTIQSAMRGAEVNVLKEVPVDKHDHDFGHYTQDPLPCVKPRTSQVSHLDASLSDDNDMSLEGLCNSNGSCTSEKTVCDWCNWTNVLQLSWCENCGHVINSSQDKYERKGQIHNQEVQTFVNSMCYSYPGTKNNSTSSYGRTHCCLESRTKNNSYQRHWKTSSLTKPPTKHLLPKIGTAMKWRISKNTIENSVRNVCTLPDELLLKIFSFLPSSSLLTCFLTCKRLHVIAADPVLWKNIVLWKASDIILQSVAMRQPIRLVFKYCSDVLTPTYIRKSFTVIGRKLKHLTIDCCSFNDNYQLLATVGVACPHLQTLHLYYVMATIPILQLMVNNCIHLEDVTLVGTGINKASISQLQGIVEWNSTY